MLAFDFKQHIDPVMLEKFSERGRRRIFKTTLTEALRYWHVHILPKHFSRDNINLYPGSFKAKKKGGIPLVQTGEFRDRMLQPPEIIATFKGAKIKYQFGRPTNSTAKGDLSAYREKYLADYRKVNPRDMERTTRNHIFHFMKGKSIKFEDARKQLLNARQSNMYKKTAYNAKTRVLMARGVSVFNDKDRAEVRTFMYNFIVDNMAKLGKANISKGGK